MVFFFLGAHEIISEHADGELPRRSCQTSKMFEACVVVETFPTVTLGFRPGPRHSPSACAPRKIKVSEGCNNYHRVGQAIIDMIL